MVLQPAEKIIANRKPASKIFTFFIMLILIMNVELLPGFYSNCFSIVEFPFNQAGKDDYNKDDNCYTTMSICYIIHTFHFLTGV